MEIISYSIILTEPPSSLCLMRTSLSDPITTKNPSSNYEAKAVALLGLGLGLLALDRWSLATLFPEISKDLNLNYQDLGNLTGILAIAWGITASLATRAPGHRPILRQPPGEYSTNQSSVGSGVFSSLAVDDERSIKIR